MSVFFAFLKLGLTSFGGPVAHLGYFRTEFVERRRWLDEASYADLIALCQFLPGPASSQVGIAIGLRRSGLLGAFAAWLGFTAPSAITMLLLAYGVGAIGPEATPWLHGLRVVAVAVIALAVWNMGRNLAPDKVRASIAVGAAAIAFAIPSVLGQMMAITLGGFAGWLSPGQRSAPSAPVAATSGTIRGIVALILFAALLVGLPIAASSHGGQALRLFDSFYRTGSLVFGGGHVVLPLLRAEVVPNGWVSDGNFLAGYGLAQAVPGPLFSFAAYLGAAMNAAPSGWRGGLLCLVAIYLPSFLLVIGLMPFWERVRGFAPARSIVQGINAAVVGLLLAALYDPGWTTSIQRPADFALAIVALLLLAYWRTPPWLVVILGAFGGWAANTITALIG